MNNHFRLAKDAQEPILDLVSRYLEDHQKTFDQNNKRDFLDLMIEEMKVNQVKNESLIPEILVPII